MTVVENAHSGKRFPHEIRTNKNVLNAARGLVGVSRLGEFCRGLSNSPDRFIQESERNGRPRLELNRHVIYANDEWLTWYRKVQEEAAADAAECELCQVAIATFERFVAERGIVGRQYLHLENCLGYGMRPNPPLSPEEVEAVADQCHELRRRVRADQRAFSWMKKENRPKYGSAMLHLQHDCKLYGDEAVLEEARAAVAALPE